MSESLNNSMETVSFRRFLSYIYAYEDDTKLRNVGFAKVEVRPPRVRFQITVNGILQKGGRPLELCLVDKDLQRIPVGQLLLQNGRGEYRGSSGVDNLWDSGLAFSQVYGICLQGAGNRRHYYMTLWREVSRPVSPSGLYRGRQIVVIPGNKAEREQQAEGESEKMIQAAEVTAEQEEEEEPREETESPPETEAQEKTEALEEAENQKETEPREETVPRKEPENQSEPESQSALTGNVQEIQNGNPINVQAKARGELQEKLQEELQEELKDELESASELMRQQSVTEAVNPAAASRTVLNQPSRRKNGDKNIELWKRFCTRYPHVDIRPLNSDERDPDDGFVKNGRICEVIRIRPNDIGRLPRNNWILAHNSFLQNAYNHYHQLILFRVENQLMDDHPGSRWFIGLPGDNSDQERLVAEVFGFRKYLRCRNGGFWYTEILLG